MIKSGHNVTKKRDAARLFFCIPAAPAPAVRLTHTPPPFVRIRDLGYAPSPRTQAAYRRLELYPPHNEIIKQPLYYNATSRDRRIFISSTPSFG